MDRRICGTCSFWAMDKSNLDRGNCRRNPPVLFPMQVGPGQINLMTKWPTTERDMKACGEHLTPEESEAKKPSHLT